MQNITDLNISSFIGKIFCKRFCEDAINIKNVLLFKTPQTTINNKLSLI